MLDYLEEGRGMSAILQGYFDESERDGGIFCVAGFLFTPRQAKKFVKEWSSLFAPYRGGLHMCDLTKKRKSFVGISDRERERLIIEAIRIIKIRMTVAVAISCNIAEIAATAP